jgi:hypothetical protein
LNGKREYIPEKSLWGTAFKHGSADYTDFHGLISLVKKDISN